MLVKEIDYYNEENVRLAGERERVAAEEMFGTDRLVDALNSCPDDTPEQLLEHVRCEVNRFVGDAPQFDDLTMLCVKLK